MTSMTVTVHFVNWGNTVTERLAIVLNSVFQRLTKNTITLSEVIIYFIVPNKYFLRGQENVSNASSYNEYAISTCTNSVTGWHCVCEGGIAMRQSKLLPSDLIMDYRVNTWDIIITVDIYHATFAKCKNNKDKNWWYLPQRNHIQAY